jgi:hypothetical protein
MKIFLIMPHELQRDLIYPPDWSPTEFHHGPSAVHDLLMTGQHLSVRESGSLLGDVKSVRCGSWGTSVPACCSAVTVLFKLLMRCAWLD